MKVYKTVVIPILTYGLELLSLSPTQLRRLNGVHAKFLRRVMGIKTTFFTEVLEPTEVTVKNFEVHQRAEVPPLSQLLERSQHKLLGHVLRAPATELMHNVCFTEGWNNREFHGKQTKGRHRPRWIHRVTQTAWKALHNPPPQLPRPHPPIRTPTFPHVRPNPHAPFQPLFHHNPFQHNATFSPSGLTALRTVAQFRGFWRDSVVRAPTRTSRGHHRVGPQAAPALASG